MSVRFSDDAALPLGSTNTNTNTNTLAAAVRPPGSVPARLSSSERSSSPERLLSSAKGTAPFADNPSLGLVPLSQTDRFLRRMGGWQRIVAKLVRFFEIVSEAERRAADACTRCSKELVLDRADSQDTFFPEESFQVLLADIVAAQSKIARDRLNTAERIDTQLLPILRELHAEVKKKSTDADKEWTLLDRDLRSDLETYVRLSNNVRHSLVRQQWKGDASSLPDMTKDVPRDPYIADVFLRKHIAACVQRQDYYIKKLLEQQDSFAAFEKVIVQNVRISLSSFYEWMGSSNTRQLEQVREMSKQLDIMQADKDWAIFKSENMDRFIEAECKLASPTSLTYDGHDDDAVKPIKEGKLQRKEGVFKKTYRPLYAVLSTSGYLHLMAPQPEGTVEVLPDGMPEYTLDLTDCSLVPLNIGDKDPDEIVLVEKSGGMFGRDSKHRLKGKNMADSSEWWNALNEHMCHLGKRSAAASYPAGSGATETASDSPVSGQRESTLSTIQTRRTSRISASGNHIMDGSNDELPHAAMPPSPSTVTAVESGLFAAGTQTKQPRQSDDFGSFQQHEFASFPPPSSVAASGSTAATSASAATNGQMPSLPPRRSPVPATVAPIIPPADNTAAKFSEVPLSTQMEMRLKAVSLKQNAPVSQPLTLAASAAGHPDFASPFGTSYAFSSSSEVPSVSTLSTAASLAVDPSMASVPPSSTNTALNNNPWATFEDDSGGW